VKASSLRWRELRLVGHRSPPFEKRAPAGGCIGLARGWKDPRAAATVEREQGNRGHLPTTEDQIAEAIRGTLRLFVGTLGFNPVNVPKLEKHLQSYSFGDKLLRSLVKERVVARKQLAVAGDGARYEIADPHAARQFLNNSVRLAGIRATIASLKERVS
jgi:hypothetical protein